MQDERHEVPRLQENNQILFQSVPDTQDIYHAAWDNSEMNIDKHLTNHWDLYFHIVCCGSQAEENLQRLSHSQF